MRRKFAILLAVLLLAGCGAEEPGDTAWMVSQPEQQGLLPESAAVDEDADFALLAEWAEYDPSVERVWFLIENRGPADAETGVDYILEKQLDNDGGAGGWYRVPMVENAAWEAVALTVPAGEAVALPCDLTLFDYDFSAGGTFCIVKELEGKTHAATFRLKEGAAVSAETPYGYAPLEELPEAYGITGAGSEVVGVDPGAGVLFIDGAIVSMERIPFFLQKVALGVPCQLRTVQDCGEGDAMVIDTIYEGDRFLWRMRSGGEITQRRFSYLVTDGQDLFLSDGADWDAGERYGDKRVFLLPEAAAGAEDVSLVEDMTQRRLAESAARYKVWSADGVWSAFLTEEPTAFAVSWERPGQGGGGRLYDLGEWDRPETAVTGLAWREDGKLRLTCDTGAGGSAALSFDPETEALMQELCGLPPAGAAG